MCLVLLLLLLLLNCLSRVQLCNPVDRSPPDSPRPSDSLGKNNGVGCHFLLQCVKVKSESEVTQSCPTLIDPMACSPPGSSVRGIFPGRSTGVGCHCFSVIVWLRFNICVIFSSSVVTLVNGMIIWEGFGVDDNFLLQ